jgi:hypothetical protein
MGKAERPNRFLEVQLASPNQVEQLAESLSAHHQVRASRVLGVAHADRRGEPGQLDAVLRAGVSTTTGLSP